MSTLLENKVSHEENVLYSKFFVVNKESLAEFVKRIRNEKDLSLADVRKRSGNQLATSYISRIENGEVTNVGLPKLEALAKGLDESNELIVALARGVEPDRKAILDDGLARGLEKLSPQKRKLALRQINSIIESLAESDDDFNYIEE